MSRDRQSLWPWDDHYGRGRRIPLRRSKQEDHLGFEGDWEWPFGLPCFCWARSPFLRKLVLSVDQSAREESQKRKDLLSFERISLPLFQLQSHGRSFLLKFRTVLLRRWRGSWKAYQWHRKFNSFWHDLRRNGHYCQEHRSSFKLEGGRLAVHFWNGGLHLRLQEQLQWNEEHWESDQVAKRNPRGG